MPTANGVFKKVCLPYALVAYPVGNDRVRVYGCICVSMSKKIYERFHEDAMYYFIMFHFILCVFYVMLFVVMFVVNCWYSLLMFCKKRLP